MLKAMDKLRDKEKGLGRFDAWLVELETTLGGRGKMGSLVGASEGFKEMAAYGSPDNLLAEYAVSTCYGDDHTHHSIFSCTI